MTHRQALAFALLAMPATAFAPISALDVETVEGITVHFGPEDAASFHLRDGAVVQVDLRARGIAYSVSLECANGGLREVHYDTAELSFSTWPETDSDVNRGVSLLFDMGREEERRFGALPRVQLGFSRGRVSELLVTRQTSESASFSDKLSESLPPRPLCAADVPRPRGLEAAAELVEQLRPLPTPLPGGPTTGERAEAERRRAAIYEQLLALGTEAVPYLAEGLEDPDAGLRRNVTLAFGALSGGWWSFECGPKKVDIGAALPALISALDDTDPSVRAWSAQDIGNIGAGAASAVPALIEMLAHGDEGGRNSAAIALRGIGPAAKSALPALREALSDPSPDVRRFASIAIEQIGGP